MMKYILVVDDEPLNRELLTDMLSGKYEVMTAVDGHACLDSVSARKPDLIVMDVTMPGLSGLEVCRKLRNDETTKDIPIILASAHISQEQQQEGFDAGANSYLCKPFYMEDLISTINKLLP